MADFKEIQIGADGQVYQVKDETARNNAGGGDGTVTGVKVGSNTYEPTEGVVDLSTPFGGKVDKVDGKGLSKNDYTDADKTKVDNLKTVATSGSYNDLTDKPVIPEGTTPDQSLDPNSDNAVSNAAVCAGLSSKANSSDLQNYATKGELTSGLSGKQNTLTFDDAPGNTDNPVKSRGIKQAIEFVTPTISPDGKWIIGGELTQHVAQGPAGNTQLLDPTTFDPTTQIINNVNDGGDTKALSAEMGKVLALNLLAIYNALSPYCFAGDKPILSWGSTIFRYSINKNGISSSINISNIVVDGDSVQAMPSAVEAGTALSFKLNLPNNLYVFDGVSIMIGSTEYANVPNVWDESTGVVTIPSVTDNIVISANAITYVGYGEQNSPLVLMFDGKNQGSTANQWENLANENKPLTLSGGYTKNTDNVQFNGTDGRGIIQNFGTDLPYDTATLEAVLSFGVLPTADTYLLGSGNDHNSLLFVGGESGNTNRRVFASQTKGEHSSTSSNLVSGRVDNAANSFLFSLNQIISLSRQGMIYTLNKTPLTEVSGNVVVVGDSQSTFNAAGYIFVSGCTTRTGAYYGPFQGKMYCIRAYSRALTVKEVAQNYKVDKKRFNIA